MEIVCRRAAALQHHARVLHRQARTDVAIDPFDLGAFLVGDRPPWSPIKTSQRPVCTVTSSIGAFHGDEFHHPGVQVAVSNFGAVHPSMYIASAAFIGNDQRALKLPKILRVDPEIPLALFTFTPDTSMKDPPLERSRRVQRAELVVSGRNHFPNHFLKISGVFRTALRSTKKSRPGRPRAF